MVLEDLPHQFDSVLSTEVGQSDKAGMRLLFEEHEPSKVGVNRDEDATILCGQFQQTGIARIGPQISRLHDVVSFASQPIGQPAASAAVDQEPHRLVTSIESSESLAMTACA